MSSDKWEIGPDGWPVDPRHPANSGPSSMPQSLDAWVLREIGKCERAWLAGSYIALIDVVMVCAEYERPLPRWANKAVFDALGAQFTGTGKGHKGRTANAKAAYLENEKHMARFYTVRELREYEGVKWTAVFIEAAERLKGTPAYGAPDTIRDSYRLVSRDAKEGKGMKYYKPNQSRVRVRR